MQEDNQNIPHKKFDSLNFNYDFSGKDFTKDKGFLEFQQKSKENIPEKPKFLFNKPNEEVSNEPTKENVIKTPEQIQEKIQSNYEQQQRAPQFVRPKPTLNFNSSQFFYKQFEEIKKTVNETEKHLNDFKERISKFADISTIAEARALSNKILPVKSDITVFRVGGAKCTVVNKPNLFRITLDSDSELLCYDFVP